MHVSLTLTLTRIVDRSIVHGTRWISTLTLTQPTTTRSAGKPRRNEAVCGAPAGAASSASSPHRPSPITRSGSTDPPTEPPTSTHLNALSQPAIVDVTHKQSTVRSAHARSMLVVPPTVARMFHGSNEVNTKKGPILCTAILAAHVGVKHTSTLIPLCHPLLITGVDVHITYHDMSDEPDLGHVAARVARFIQNPLKPFTHTTTERNTQTTYHANTTTKHNTTQPTDTPTTTTTTTTHTHTDTDTDWSPPASDSGSTGPGYGVLVADCHVTCTGKTGVEMEALTGASVACLTLYDMCKAHSHDMIIAGTHLISKTGGKTDFQRTTTPTPTPTTTTTTTTHSNSDSDSDSDSDCCSGL